MRKTLLKCALSIIVVSLLFAACDDAIEVEPKYKEDYLHSNKTPEYYEALRAYKKSDHAIAFGWFGNWSGVGASLANCMAGLPDSVDVISMWGGWRNPSPQHLEDLRYVQQVKGTKALMCFIIDNIGTQLTPQEVTSKWEEDGFSSSMDAVKDYWGWVDGDEEAIAEAIAKYANAICDTIDKYDYDGFDIDYEPNWGHAGNLSSYPKNMKTFVETLAKRIGPKSGTGRLLVIDGEPQTIEPTTGPCFDYFIVQAYSSPDYTDLDDRLGTTIQNYVGVLSAEEVAKKYVVTENFEDHSATGGIEHETRDGKWVKSLEGMALWNPIINGVPARKGGVGTYHMEYEFSISGLSGTYPYLRKAIQIMNPNLE